MVSVCLKKRESMGEICMNYEVKGVRTRGRLKKKLSEVVKKDRQTQQLYKEGAMNCRK